MRIYTNEELKAIIESHLNWLLEIKGGRCANLRDVDLRGVNLSGVNLRDADLRGVNLSGVNLRGANLSDVNLSGVDLRGVNLSGVNLRDVDLSGADLSGANLSGVNLSGAQGNSHNIKTIQTDHWTVVYSNNLMYIGCESHSFDQWWNFSDDEIDNMSQNALEFWRKWKDVLQTIILISPAVATREEEVVSSES
ncbi:pentapeptide repeat-containing protein (plasmid) [Leptospira interrogans]|uniref:pentapeptide repeat-containing protein n=1 Tax=Leptospira interrogans TaxID=173 RepID=UPI001F07D576|nr:pentapeptide repeat-containing protein [Leptospira interrogans]UML83073.1 pentapeptide repeat-containing protein [Leptospira interrogans]UML83103.1 pentapeptide repeat-containing protein [Leptospira interrogans]